MGGFFDQLAGGQGEYYKPKMDWTSGRLLQDEARSAAEGGSMEVAQAALRGQDIAPGMENVLKDPAGMRYLRATVENPLIGSALATQQVQQNPILAQLYGKGGALERASAEEKALGSANEMRPEDYERFGQESGDITRMYGQQEGELARALQSRGMGQSGAAGKAYAGQMGNKYEQLANLQRQVRQDAFTRKMNQMQQTRNYLTTLGGQAGNEIQNQYGRQMGGVGSARNLLTSAASNEANQNQVQGQAEMASQQSKEANYAPGFLENMGAGFTSSGYGFGKSMGDHATGQHAQKKADQASSSMMGGGGGGGGGAAGLGKLMSDSNAKTNIMDADLTETLDKLNAYTYQYLNPTNGEGTYTGVMAQDLQNTKYGGFLVDTINGYKVIDSVKAISFLLASVAHLNKQLKDKDNA